MICWLEFCFYYFLANLKKNATLLTNDCCCPVNYFKDHQIVWLYWWVYNLSTRMPYIRCSTIDRSCWEFYTVFILSSAICAYECIDIGSGWHRWYGPTLFDQHVLLKFWFAIYIGATMLADSHTPLKTIRSSPKGTFLFHFLHLEAFHDKASHQQMVKIWQNFD